MSVRTLTASVLSNPGDFAMQKSLMVMLRRTCGRLALGARSAACADLPLYGGRSENVMTIRRIARCRLLGCEGARR